ncbi:helix-turn-helix domain-containing protein [Nesterenkonia sp. CF4.4]|uniref:helix-turn-helix domain-containing protein n=1 Tax=Nesterenkonia sp. CF4.4 TaxID=3373079 RepID=UPI003EE6D646
MNREREPYAMAERLLGQMDDRDQAARTPVPERLSRYAAVMVFRGWSFAHLRARIERAAPGSLVTPWADGAVVLSDEVTALRRLAENAHDLCLGLDHVLSDQPIEQSCIQATQALGFTHFGSAVSRAMSFRELGGLTVLYSFTSQGLQDLPSMDAVQMIGSTDGGRADLDAVEALCRLGSLRKAAVALHMHHSSVAIRIRSVEDELGYRFTGAIPLTTAYAAILGARLLSARKPDCPD